MDQSEATTFSFIIKIWVEAVVDDAGQVAWHGYVTHVPDGTRRYLKDLDALALFIAPYLEQAGVRLGICWQVRQWLRRRKTVSDS